MTLLSILFACADPVAAPSATATTAETGVAVPTADTTPAPEPDPKPTCLGAGEHDFTVDVQGTPFRYRLRIPTGGAEAHPVIVQFHGGGSSGEAMETVSRLSELGEPQGFATLTPEGHAVVGMIQVWNAGACCGPTATLPDHVAATLAMLDHAQSEGACLDEARVYATGHSNGGMMAYRLACEASERVAAIAISAGTLASEDQTEEPPTVAFGCALDRPVPLLHIHGIEDLCVPYDGSLSALGNDLLSVEASVDVFRSRAGCPSTPVDVTKGEVRRRVWTCPDDVEVELVTVESLGHAWAGSSIYGSADRCGGTTTTAVSTTDEALAFFSRH